MKNLIIVLFLVCISVSLINAQDSNQTFHPFSNSVAFSAEFGGTYPITDLAISDLDILGKGIIEYFIPSRSNHTLGIRLIGGAGFLTGNGQIDYLELDYKTRFFYLGGGFTYALNIGNSIPYFSSAISYLRFEPRDNEGFLLPSNRQNLYNSNVVMYITEIGVRFPFAELLSLNLGINFNFTNIDFLEDIELNSDNDLFASAFIGISIYSGADRDSDSDGIEDSQDDCPDTPLGYLVDETGCPVDSDSDGVPDYLDLCNDTPNYLRVDENGCALDLDQDGVADYFDKCKNTPLGKVVDENGCPVKESPVKKDTITVKEISPLFEDNTQLTGSYDSLNDEHIKDQIYTDGKYFSIQIGTFQNKITAERKINELLFEGHNTFMIETSLANSPKVFYRVRIGPFNSLNDAENYRENYSK